MDRDYPASLIHGQGWVGIGHLSHKSDLKKQGESTCLWQTKQQSTMTRSDVGMK